MMLFLNYCIFSGSAETLVRCGGKLLIANFLGNMCARYYENPTMLSKVTAKNVGDVFETHCRSVHSRQQERNRVQTWTERRSAMHNATRCRGRVATTT